MPDYSKVLLSPRELDIFESLVGMSKQSLPPGKNQLESVFTMTGPNQDGLVWVERIDQVNNWQKFPNFFAAPSNVFGLCQKGLLVWVKMGRAFSVSPYGLAYFDYLLNPPALAAKFSCLKCHFLVHEYSGLTPPMGAEQTFSVEPKIRREIEVRNFDNVPENTILRCYREVWDSKGFSQVRVQEIAARDRSAGGEKCFFMTRNPDRRLPEAMAWVEKQRFPSLAAASSSVSLINVQAGTSTSKENESEQNVFRFTGEVFEITFDQLTIHLPDAKGLRYIGELLAHPQEAIDSVSLMTTASPSTMNEKTAIQEGLSIGSPENSLHGIDDKAKAQYKKRLCEIGRERSQAEAISDEPKIEELNKETKGIERELKISIGLRGRLRKTSGTTEKARKAVTNSIKNILKKLRTTHPALWKHLSGSIEFGYECSYRPKTSTAWNT
jgi:hypothetical protein